MRICLLSGEVLGARHGGAVHTTEVARALVRQGHTILLVTPGRLDDPGITHLPCDMKSWGLTRTGQARKHEKYIREFEPELIYERQLIGGGYGGELGRRLGVPVVYEVNSPHLQEMLHRFPLLKLIKPWLAARERRQFSNCTLVVTTHDSLVPTHYSGARLVGPWAVRTPSVAGDIKLWPELEDKKIILVAGSFQDWHGISHVESVIRELSLDGVGVALVGGGEGRRQLARRLKDQFSGPVLDVGTLSPDEMGAAYLKADVLLAPFDPPLARRLFYYSPFKILEALSYGLPVLTDDHDNLKDLLDESWCGQTVSGRDPVHWANTLRQILKVERPSSEKGAAYASRHSWDAHVKTIVDMLP